MNYVEYISELSQQIDLFLIQDSINVANMVCMAQSRAGFDGFLLLPSSDLASRAVNEDAGKNLTF